MCRGPPWELRTTTPPPGRPVSAFSLLKRVVERDVGASLLRVGALTSFAYLIGIGRDAVLATFYGGSTALDIYFVALAPSQFVGMEAASLTYLALLPEFSKAFRGAGGRSGTYMLRERLLFIGKATLGLAFLFAVLGVLIAPVLAPGYAGHRAMSSLRISLAVLCLLIPALTVGGVLRAALETKGWFSAWALLPAFRSAAIIVFAMLTATRPGVGWLVAGTLIGVSFFLGYAALLSHSQRFFQSHNESPEPVVGKGFPTSLLPLLGSVLLGQVTVALDNAFASHTGIGGVQQFALASNLLGVPQTVIGGAVATVFFPLYGTLWASGQKAAAVESLRKSTRMAVYGILPVVVAVIFGGHAVVRLIYQHGVFDEGMTLTVTQAVAGLALGQVAYASSVLLRQFLLVAGAPWALFEASAVFLAVKWVGNLALADRFGVPGIALSSSLAAASTCGYLVVRLIRTARGAREV